MIQQHKLGEADYRGTRFAEHGKDLKGNNDLLVLTRPDVVGGIHRAYLEELATAYCGTGELRSDPRVVCLEGINSRSLVAADLGPAMPAGGFDLIVADLSFISLTLILPQLPALLGPNGQMLLLVKPQFEVGPHNLGKGGVVKDPALYGEVEAKLRSCAADCQLSVKGWFDSPIVGGGVGHIQGNREFFIWLAPETP